jgi:hypothetical protein
MRSLQNYTFDENGKLVFTDYVADPKDPNIEKEQEDSESLEPFESEMTYTPSTVLEDDKAMSVIRNYMKDFEGIREGDMSDKELVDSYVNRMRRFSAGQSVVTLGEFNQLRKASDDKLANAGQAYSLFDKFGGVFSEDYTWGELFDGVYDYARAIVVDPTNLLGLGVGKVVATAGAKGSSQVLKKIAIEAGKAKIEQELKRRGVKSLGEKETKKIMREAGRKAIEQEMKSAAVTTAVKSSAKKEILAATATDGVLALGVDYAYQSGMIMTGQQDSWSPFQSGLTALGILGGGLLSGGLALTEKSIKSARSKLGEKSLTLNEKLYGVDLKEVVAKEQAKKLKPNKQKVVASVEKLLDSFKKSDLAEEITNEIGDTTWMQRISDDTSGDLESNLYFNKFFRYFLLGNDEKGIEGFAKIITDNGIRFPGARYKGDNVTSFVADIMEYMPEDLLKDINKSISKHMPKLGKQYENMDSKQLANLFSIQQSRAGSNLQISSEIAKRIGVQVSDTFDPKTGKLVEGTQTTDLTFSDYLDDINPEIDRTKLTGKGSENINYYQNLTIQAIVSNPATTALNIIGTTYRGTLDTLADQARGVLYGGAIGLKGLATGDKKLLNKAKNIVLMQGRRVANLVSPDSTREQVLSYLSMRPEVEDKLFRYLSGGVDNKALMKEFGIDPAERFDVRFAEKYKDFFQKIYAVRFQDEFFKMQNFMYYLDKNIREEYGQTYQKFLDQGSDSLANIITSQKYRALEAKALDETADSVFAKSFSSRKTRTRDPISFLATGIEELRKVPIVGITVPFGQFFNGTVNFMSDYLGAKFLMRNFSAVKNALYKNPDGITLDQYTESMSRMAVGWTAMWYMSDNEMSYINQGLSWKEERDTDGSVQSKEYDFPESFFKMGARLIAYKRLDQEIPSELLGQAAETFSYQSLLRTLGQKFDDIEKASKDLITLESIPELGGDIVQIFGSIGSSFVSGATRPLDPINQLVGMVADGDQFDRRQGSKNFNDSLRYVDQITTPILDYIGMTESEVKESATTSDKSMTLGRLIGYRENMAQSATQKMFNSIEKPEWKTSIYTDAPKADNRVNKIIAPILEREAEIVLNRKNYKNLRLKDKQKLVSDAISKAKKKALYTLKVSNIIEDRHLQRVFSLYNSYSNKQIEDALKEKGFEERDLMDLNSSQLDLLKNFMKTENYRQKIRISSTPAN